MKQYIKDNEIYNLPILINNNGITIYTNDENVILANGYTEYISPTIELSLEQLIEQSNNEINQITDNKILNNFKYKNNEFYLSTENQMNFANMYIAKDYLTYPQIIKTKTGFTALQNAEEVTEFYLAGVNFIKQCLQECWEEKAQAEQQIRENYQNNQN